MYLRRPGGQLQFSRYNLQQTATRGPINDLLAWLLENLTADLSVDKLAEKVAMSPRNFTRVFTRETGASPARYVAEARPPPRGSVWSRLTRRWIVSPSKRDLAAVLTCDACLRNSLTSLGEYRQRFHCRKMA